jgi:hypothetical protein
MTCQGTATPRQTRNGGMLVNLSQTNQAHVRACSRSPDHTLVGSPNQPSSSSPASRTRPHSDKRNRDAMSQDNRTRTPHRKGLSGSISTCTNVNVRQLYLRRSRGTCMGASSWGPAHTPVKCQHDFHRNARDLSGRTPLQHMAINRKNANGSAAQRR